MSKNTQKTLFGEIALKISPETFKKVAPPEFNTITFRTLPSKLKREILTRKINALQTDWYGNYRQDQRTTAQKIQQLKHLLEYARQEHKTIPNLKDVLPPKKAFFTKTLEATPELELSQLREHLMNRSNFEAISHLRWVLSGLHVSISSIMEADEIKKENDTRKELGLMHDETLREQIKTIETFIIKYVNEIYTPILDKICDSMKRLDAYMDEHYKLIDQIDNAIHELPLPDALEISLYDDLTFKILEKGEFPKHVKEMQFTAIVRSLEFTDLPLDLQANIINVIKPFI